MSKPLKDLVHQLIPQEFQWKITLLENWSNIIGPLHDKVAIHAIHEQSLILEVSHPAWAQELLHLTPLIKEKVNTALQRSYIQDVRFRVAAMQRQVWSKTTKKRAAFSSSLKNKETTSYTLSNREESALTSCNNEELKAAMRAFLIACKRA